MYKFKREFLFLLCSDVGTVAEVLFSQESLPIVLMGHRYVFMILCRYIRVEVLSELMQIFMVQYRCPGPAGCGKLLLLFYVRV